MAKAPVIANQVHETKMAWVHNGPNAGKMIELSNADFDRAVKNGWAEDPTGKGSFDLKAPYHGAHEDADRFARGLPSLTAAEIKSNEAARIEQYGAPDVTNANDTPAQPAKAPAKAPAAPAKAEAKAGEPVSSEVVRGKPATVKARASTGTHETRTMRATRRS